MGSAVDRTNITRELQRYQASGLGGVHIIPIYGAKGYESQFIDYLSPKWMEMLAWTCSEAQRLGMGVDMTTGSGWCFGGPRVKDGEANAAVVLKTFDVPVGGQFREKFSPGSVQALVAFTADNSNVDLTARIAADGTVEWPPPSGSGKWTVYAVSQKPSGQKVKRASPGGSGWMLNLFYPEAMQGYLKWFDEAFANYSGPRPRAMYHDSYEYRSDWAPDLFASFEKRRGYKLQSELTALFDKASNDRTRRVKSDYRETISDVMAEETLPMWSAWSHQHGFITRNEAHGSPGNWLDLYATADVPETEMFYKDRNKLISKFASSAAHVTGKTLVASETGTWLKEHFTETLADMKYLLDDLFLSGINHVVYHGTCYSPDEAGWPGWHFYASYEMNPRNSIWRDADALNAYAARCQSVLQSGKPDNDILLYWPIYDLWHSQSGMARNLNIHARDWFEEQPLGKTAERLWKSSYAFDYVSDRQLKAATTAGDSINTPGGSYRAILVPPTEHIPLDTFRRLLDLAHGGARVLFQDSLPADVPGWGNLEARRSEFKAALSALKFNGGPIREAVWGKGRVLVGDLNAILQRAGIRRESLLDTPGLMCIRRLTENGCYYLVANRSEESAFDGWLPISANASAILILDPMTGCAGTAEARRVANGTEVRLALGPGESVILRCYAKDGPPVPKWRYSEPSAPPVALTGTWSGTFLQGGPELPASFQMTHLQSWTTLGETNAQRFAGTARYTLQFDAPPRISAPCWLDLGNVCQCARVRLNGADLGTLITRPYRVRLESIKKTGNVLEVDITNVSANRIRDLDRRGVQWKNFYDINFVNLDYKPFDASNWPLTDSGLLGPVTLTPLKKSRL